MAPLLLGSGFAALVDQVVWEREFRLIFGVTTAAQAAVIAVFIAGLGLGSAWLGQRADRHPCPLRWYAHLELGVAACVAVTPALLGAARMAYVALGGSARLGAGFGTLLRLGLAGLILLPPTLLMGGTLPAAARAIESPEDDGRGATGLIYGTNTMGAVLGALASTLLVVEVFGNRLVLFMAALVSALIGVSARALARTDDFATPPPAEQPASAVAPAAPAWLVVTAAALVGFVFFVMELVAPRLLGPLLGGTVFTFGLVLAVALAGIGLGGLVYGRIRRRPCLGDLGVTCAVEALCFAVPLGLGDRIALLALRLRPLHDFGFGGYVCVAVVITSVVLLPAAVVSGYQFPLLIGLLGHGRERVGRDVGRAYAANTLGAMLGALAGGFWLMPALSAPGCWRLVVVVLAALGAALGVGSGIRHGGWLRSAAVPLGLATLAAAAGWAATGPTAVWRHGGIGAGRSDLGRFATPNGARAQANRADRRVLLQRDGREASVAVLSGDEMALVVTGKADGSIVDDAATQVGSGLLAALRHPAPRRAMVVGLATGCTAGWLRAVPSIERVDVVELEPATVEMARVSAAVNEHALDNPKLHLFIADAREWLLTTRARYDLVVSEPSNPYRAGVASLYTQEFYLAVAQRLDAHGIFVQWVQGYEIDAAAVRTAFGTITSVFPHAELWELSPNDLVVLASRDELRWNLGELEARVRQEPYRKALRVALRTEGLEGILARLRGRAPFVRQVAGDPPVLNTDDQNLLEFAFARTLGRMDYVHVAQLLKAARTAGLDRPPASAAIDWQRVADEFVSMGAAYELRHAGTRIDSSVQARTAAKLAYGEGNLSAAWNLWQGQPDPPRSPVERLLAAECATAAGAPEASELLRLLGATQPTEAALIGARTRCPGNADGCGAALVHGIEAMRRDPWVYFPVARRFLKFVQWTVNEQPKLGPRVIGALPAPFAVRNLEETRRELFLELTTALGRPECRSAHEAVEPYPIWSRPALQRRVRCYELTHSPYLVRARSDLAEFLADEPSRFE